MNEPVRTMDGFGPEDMAIPEVKLIQNVGGQDAKAGGAKAGDFHCNVTGEIFKGDTGFDIVVVDIRKNRTYWGRVEIEDEPPICASLDAKTNLQGESCDQCAYEVRCDTPWLLDATERRNKCLLNYNVLAIDARNYLPMLIRASGISTQSVRELLTALRLNKQLHGEYHRALVHVTSQAKKTAQGEAFAMLLRATKLVSDAKQVEDLKTQSLQLLGVTLLPEGVTKTTETAESKTESGQNLTTVSIEQSQEVLAATKTAPEDKTKTPTPPVPQKAAKVAPAIDTDF